MKFRTVIGCGLALLIWPAAGCEFGSFQHQTAYMADGGTIAGDSCVPLPEICDGLDNDCDGLIDNDDPGIIANDVSNCGQCGHVCDLTNVDVHSCEDGECGIAKCDEGFSDLNETAADGCESNCIKTMDWDPCDGEDNDCNGVVDDGFDLDNDPNNCGACGYRCENEFALGTYHVLSFGCSAGQCAIAACEAGYFDRDGVMDDGSGALGCEYACTVTSTVEICNGVDDDCDGAIDNNPVGAPACLSQGVCAGVTAVCNPTGGTWSCPYPASYQQNEDDSNPPGCDGLDNDCDGQVDEGFAVGQTCWLGIGDCERSGQWVCNSGGTDSECNAVPGTPGTEVCDGEDNDCDGDVDEDRWSDAGNGNYVSPAVVNVGGVYMFAYEASRPNAGTATAGTGNGYHCSSCGGGVPGAPSGVPLEATRACSVQGKLPWFNVSPIEAEQTCQALGGRVCTQGDWETACLSGSSCRWGFGSNCSNYSTGGTCNLGDFDFDTSAGGDQDGLLETGSSRLTNCYSDWGGSGDIFDMTGNLREITSAGSGDYALMGGAFNTGSETGAECDFGFYVVDDSFRLLDTGFRCCFDSDPS